MRAFLRFRFWRGLRYRLGVLGVCCAYMLAALEIPLPVFVHKNIAQPFPCQDHPCGCRTAEQCWSHCCCFTPEERWAWASAHNVQPPAYAEKPAAPSSNGWNTVKLRDRAATATKSCCSAKTEHASCCQTAAKSPEKSSSSSDGRIRWTTAMNAWHCQGYSTLWVSIGSVLPVPPRTVWVADETPPAYIPLLSVRTDKSSSTPLDPPPRLSLV